MNYVALSMRTDNYRDINETRDAIDKHWYSFLKSCGLFPLLLPNSMDALYLLDVVQIKGVILTGGNSLHFLGGDAQERDEFEIALIEQCIKRKMPIFGVCRGMQMIQNYFGVKLSKIEGHIRTRHDITYSNTAINVNSYHAFGTLDSVEELIIKARSEDNVVEAVQHVQLPFYGIMWHPEREKFFSEHDKNLVKECFLI